MTLSIVALASPVISTVTKWSIPPAVRLQRKKPLSCHQHDRERSEVFFAGPGVDQTIANGVEWLLPDHLGTVRDRVTIGDHVRAHIQYDSFGVILNPATLPTTVTLDSRDRCGTPTLVSISSGSVVFAEYWPLHQHDPLGFGAGDVNLYRMVGNSPLSFTDPTGMYTESIVQGTRIVPADDPLIQSGYIQSTWIGQLYVKETQMDLETRIYHNRVWLVSNRAMCGTYQLTTSAMAAF